MGQFERAGPRKSAARTGLRPRSRASDASCVNGRRTLGLVACLVASVACSKAPAPLAVADPLPASGTVAAEELPPAVLAMYQLQRDSESPYRAGSLDVELSKYVTDSGDVFVDFGSGGMAFAESCAALEEFRTANTWNRGAGCLDE